MSKWRLGQDFHQAVETKLLSSGKCKGICSKLKGFFLSELEQTRMTADHLERVLKGKQYRFKTKYNSAGFNNRIHSDELLNLESSVFESFYWG